VLILEEDLATTYRIGIRIVLVHQIMTVILVCQMLIAWGIAYHLVIKYDYYLGFVAVYFYSSRSYRCMYAFSPIYLSPLLKENVRPGRKRILDDALFEFFRKEVV
jgi:hypothetical protein